MVTLTESSHERTSFSLQVDEGPLLSRSVLHDVRATRTLDPADLPPWRH